MTLAQSNKTFPLRLSHSSLELLNSCERKFQIQKLLAAPRREDSAHFDFGHGFGAGVATYLLTQSQDRAIFAAWMAYDSYREEKKKTRYSCIWYLCQSFSYLDTLLKNYEIAMFNGKPAAELSFRMDINETKYFVGHIDVVLRHRVKGTYYVMEVKTTGLQLTDLDPEYRHSNQTVGYSTALDTIVGEELSEYGVLYFVCQLPAWNATEDIAKFHIMPYAKTLTDRLQWFVAMGMDVQRIEQMEQLGIFPRRNSSCVSYNKVCTHFGTCHLEEADMPAQQEEDKIEYQFRFNLDDVIANHLERIARLPRKQTMGEPLRDFSNNAGVTSID